jgi:N-acetylmuramoyl-L-alanine amidase
VSFSPDYPAARVVPSPNHGERTRAVSMLILHYTGLPTAEAALSLLTSSAAEVSAHYFVEEDGSIAQLVPEDRRAWHAGKGFWAGETDINSASIGIEIVHPGHRDPRPFPSVQMAAVAALSRDICMRRGIAAERVLAHSDTAVGRKIDPGEFFPWGALAAAGVGRYAPPAPLAGDTGLGVGAEGPAVSALQRQLADYGYGVVVDGRFDEETAKVVAAFQRHFRPVKIDGRWDVSTARTLEGLLAGAHEATAACVGARWAGKSRGYGRA